MRARDHVLSDAVWRSETDPRPTAVNSRGQLFKCQQIDQHVDRRDCLWVILSLSLSRETRSRKLTSSLRAWEPLSTTAAYAAATVASCSIAVGLSQLVPRLRVSPAARSLLGKLVPFAAVASAGCVNIGLMRWKEMRDGERLGCSCSGRVKSAHDADCCALTWLGISVFPPSDSQTGRPNNEVLGKSSIAGTYAVGQTAASRVLTNMCVRVLFGSGRGVALQIDAGVFFFRAARL